MGEQDGATENGATDAPGLALCALHALRFDPALTRGCVLCRRPAQPVVAEPPRSGWAVSTLLMAAAVAVLALLLVLDLGGGLAGFGATAVPAAPSSERASKAHASAAKTRPVREAAAQNDQADVRETECMRAARATDDARPNAVDAHARTALMLAARANHAEAMSGLAARGAAIEARCERGMSALHHAAEGSACTEALVRLLDLHADIEAVDTGGATPLMLAARAGHADVVRVLLDRGARMEHRDYRGFGVLDYLVMPRDDANAAAHADLSAVLQLLGQRGVEPQLALDARTTPIVLRADLDAWLRAHGRPGLPAYAPADGQPARSEVKSGARGGEDDSHGVLQLLSRNGPADSRSVPAWVYPEFGITLGPFMQRVPNVLQQVRLRGLALRAGQQVTLSADAAGNVPWEVDDVLLIERLNGTQRVDSAFVGRADGVTLNMQPVRRIGERALKYTRGAVDFTPWFAADARADRVIVSALDWGGWTSVSDVYLHVFGPDAKRSIKGVEIETMRPR